MNHFYKINLRNNKYLKKKNKDKQINKKINNLKKNKHFYFYRYLHGSRNFKIRRKFKKFSFKFKYNLKNKKQLHFFIKINPKIRRKLVISFRRRLRINLKYAFKSSRLWNKIVRLNSSKFNFNLLLQQKTAKFNKNCLNFIIYLNLKKNKNLINKFKIKNSLISILKENLYKEFNVKKITQKKIFKKSYFLNIFFRNLYYKLYLKKYKNSLLFKLQNYLYLFRKNSDIFMKSIFYRKLNTLNFTLQKEFKRFKNYKKKILRKKFFKKHKKLLHKFKKISKKGINLNLNLFFQRFLLKKKIKVRNKNYVINILKKIKNLIEFQEFVYLTKLQDRLKFIRKKSKFFFKFKKKNQNPFEIRFKNLKIKNKFLNVYYHKKVKSLSLTNFISKSLWKIQRLNKFLDLNLVNISYFYFYKRNKFDKLLLDKLNFKGIFLNNLKNFNLKKIFQFLFYFCFRTYLKNSQISYFSILNILHKKNKLNVKNKKIKKPWIFYLQQNKFFKIPDFFLNKKYLILKKRIFLMKFILRNLYFLFNINIQIKFKEYSFILKNLLKFLIIPLAITKEKCSLNKFKKRNKIFFFFSQLILYNIKQLIKTNNIVINFYGIIEENITADLILKRILRKMDKKQSLKWLILKIIRRLEKSRNFFGLKVKFAGRLSANIMGRVYIIQQGLISTNNMNVYIDYAKDAIILKYGKCGIKVWLVRNLNIYMPYKYIYSYKYN